jgi:hypothetical protein
VTHLLVAVVLFIIIPFALVGAASLWEHLSDDDDDTLR